MIGVDKKGKGIIIGAQAHRLAWIIAHNKMPNDGEVVRHKCNEPNCCNPDHLHIGSRVENTIDAMKAGLHGSVKLSPSQVREIRKLWEIGYSTKELGEKFGVNQKTAWEAAKRISHTWVK